MLYIQIKTKRLRHLLTTAKTKDEVKSALLLDVVIRKSTTILQLLSSENETLLVRRDALLILNLRLDVVNGVGRLHLEGDRLAGQGLHEDLHAAAETKDEMEGALLLNVIVGEGATVLELLSSKDQTLLIGWDTLLVLDLGLDVINSIDRKSTRLNSSHSGESRMPSSA